MSSKNVRTFELKLGKRALVLFIIGMSCLLFIVFLFGVTVGKNIDTYPEKFARGIPSMIKEKLGWSSNRIDTTETVSEPSKEYSKSAGEEKATEEKKVSVTVPVGNEEPQAAVQAPASTQEQKSSVSPVVEQAKKKPPRMDEKYLINVVSYKEKDKANRLYKKLKDLGFTPKITEAELHEKGKWFRVTLEGFDSREQAQKVADDVTKKIRGLNCAIHKVVIKNN
ncbi:MAG TPA: SPOR domain-containing protein [Syntrophales bacterium]|nr:SPOR domain-containing protein [Syntrophales bacterium]